MTTKKDSDAGKRVVFLVPVRNDQTQGVYFPAGRVADLASEDAQVLIDEGYAKSLDNGDTVPVANLVTNLRDPLFGSLVNTKDKQPLPTDVGPAELAKNDYTGVTATEEAKETNAEGGPKPEGEEAIPEGKKGDSKASKSEK